MYAATGGPNVKWGADTTAPPLATSLEISINRVMSPSDAVHIESTCNSLFEFQVVHRYVFTVV